MIKDNKSYKTPLIGFYSRKLIFFACLFVAFLFVYTNINYYSADVFDEDSFFSKQDKEILVEVDDRGVIQVDGQRVEDRVNIAGSFEEIRFPVLEKSGRYFDQVKIVLKLPKSVAYRSEHEILAIYGVEETDSYIQDDKTIVYTATDLSPVAEISIVAKMPRGTFKLPLNHIISSYVSSVNFDFWLIIGILLPVITFIYMLLFINYQIRRQRIDVPEKETDAPPMAIPPAVVGALYRQKVGSREIAATIIDLALRGNIYILDRERDFAFLKNKFDNRLLSYEKILLSKIFKDHLTSDKEEIEKRINNHLYSKKISATVTGVYVLATRLGYFKINPQKVHMQYQMVGLAGFFIGLLGFVLSFMVFKDTPYVAFFWIGMMISSLIIASLAKKMPLRTVIGQESLSNWLAFRKYLSSREKIPFSYDAIDLFQKYLPYAIALDCEVAWTNRFSEQNFVIPKWFVTESTSSGLKDFCLSLFPIISYVSRSLAAITEPGKK